MRISKSNNMEKLLQKPDIHQHWANTYRNPENETFYDEVFSYIKQILNAPENAIFLDAGCGSCAHSVRLAKRGFFVLAIDFSESALKMAEVNIKSTDLADKIKLQHENIISLSFPDNTFDYILCWGVLMHIPDIEKAISELNRILKKGGVIIISEGNMFSVQSLLLRSLKLFRRSKKATMIKTAAGLEYWEVTHLGKLMTRHANIRWLKQSFRSKGFTIIKHISGQFTEFYTKFSSPMIRKFIHAFNKWWFKYVKIPYFAFGNLLILQK